MTTNTHSPKETDGLDATCTIIIGDSSQNQANCDKTIICNKTEGNYSDNVLETVLDFFQHRVLKPTRKHNPNTANTSVVGEAKEIKVGEEVIDEKILEELSKHYEIQKTFAEGGQGIISSAQDKILHRIVALKSLRKEHLENESVRRAFVNEALITAQLEHPSIVSAYSLLKDDANGIHLTMQLIRGRTLKALLEEEITAFEQGKRLRWNYMETLREHMVIFMKTCEAIGYAHSRNIIHCDLKPENIMVGEYGEAYVMDWGIAKNITAEREAVENGTRILDGTPRFMPPEAFSGNPRTQLSDIYELGMILYEIVCLQRGYDTRDIKTLVRKICAGERKPVRNRFGIPISRDLAAIIDKATAQNPEDRYKDTTALVNDVRNYLSDLPIIARPDNFWMKTRRFLVHHIQLVVAIAFIGWIYGLLISVQSLKQMRDQAIHERDLAESQAKQQLTINHTLNYEQTLLRMNGNVIHASITLSNKMTEIARQLKRIVDYTEFLSDVVNVPNEKQRRTLPIYNYADFQDPDSPTRGSIASPTYYGKAINPDVLSYVVPLHADKTAYTEHLSKLRLVSFALYSMVLSSSGEELFSPRQEDELKSLMLTKGLLIRRAYIGMASTGLQIAYPFNPEYDSAYDNRKRDWYTATQKNFEKNGSKKAVWSVPYKDSGKDGRLLLACTLPIISNDNEFLGVAGADIHFEYLVNLIANNGNDIDQGIVEKFLINSDGDTLCHIDGSVLRKLEEGVSGINMDFILDSSRKLPDTVIQKVLGREYEYGYVKHLDEAGKDCIYFYSFLPNSDICIVEKSEKQIILNSLKPDMPSLEDIWD